MEKEISKDLGEEIISKLENLKEILESKYGGLKNGDECAITLGSKV